MRNLFGSQGPPGWLVTGGIASVALGYVFLAFLPAQKGIGTKRGELKEKQEYIARSERLATMLGVTRLQLDKTQEAVKKWKQDAPAPQQLSRVYAQVSDEARQSGVRILRLDPQPPREHSLLSENGVTVSVEGTFEGIFLFCKGVEKQPQTIWMRNVSMRRIGEDGGDLRCDMTLTIFGDLAEKSD